MTQADEMFFAWLDGELTGAEAAEVEARVAANPELQALAAQHRALGAQLKTAFDPIAEQPVALPAYAPPESGNVASLAQARVARRPVSRFWAQGAAIAATFVLGIATGNMLLSGPATPIAPEGGQLVAAASLKDALSTQLASQPRATGPRIGLTYRGKDGKLCRTFTDQAAQGLACFNNGDWRVRALFQGAEGDVGDYRMAAGPDPQLSALVDESIAGEPFDEAQEQAARDKGWK
jgi:hypothetical protein